MNPIYYTVFNKKTIFIPLRYLYPECSTLIQPHSAVNPLQCLETSCPVSAGCMNTLVNRVFSIFAQVDTAEMLVAYFKLPSGRIKAGVFFEDMETPPSVKVCNPYALKKFQREGVVYQWVPNESFYLPAGYKGPIITGEPIV